MRRTAKHADIFKIFILAAILIAVNQLSVIFSKVISEKEFKKINSTEWIADLDDLRPGDYFISAGKPTGLCDLEIGDKTVVRGHTSGRSTRDALLLGTSFSIQSASQAPNFAAIKCNTVAGVPLKFPEPPVVLKRDIGFVLHGWRFFSHILLGPGSSLILLILLMTQKSARNVSIADRSNRIFFAVIALVYSLSLAYVTRFFLPINVSYVVHTILRCTLTYVVLDLSGIQDRWKRLNLGLWLFSLFSILIFSITHFPWVVFLYRFLHVCWSTFVISNSVLTWKRPAATMNDNFYRTVVTIAAFFHVTDVLSMLIENINVQYPIFLALLCFLIGRQARREASRSDALHASAYQILRFIQSEGALSEKFLRAVEQVQNHNPLLRMSAYVDSFCFGRSSEPKRRLERVLDYGYRKDTSSDGVIDISDGRGQLMLQAISTGKVVIGIGADKCQYAIVPIGAHACINLSDDEPREPAYGVEAREVLEFLEPAIRSLDVEFRKTAERSRLPINGLLAKRGLGTFSENVGSIFLDVVGYSRQTQSLNDPFGAFVKGVYFSAIERSLQDYVVREFSRGDELYLCAIDGFPSQRKAADAIAQALQILANFVNSEGDKLCSDHGFPRIRLTVGASAGLADLIVTESDVTTMGDTVNEAKRLQEAANSGEILVSSSIAAIVSQSDAHVGPANPRLVKGSLIVSHSIRFLTTQNTNRAS